MKKNRQIMHDDHFCFGGLLAMKEICTITEEIGPIMMFILTEPHTISFYSDQRYS